LKYEKELQAPFPKFFTIFFSKDFFSTENFFSRKTFFTKNFFSRKISLNPQIVFYFLLQIVLYISITIVMMQSQL